MNKTRVLTVFGPPRLRAFLEHGFEVSQAAASRLIFKFPTFTWFELRIYMYPHTETMNTIAYGFFGHPSRGKFDVERFARDFPYILKSQYNKLITDSAIPSAYLAPDIRGKTLLFIGDTSKPALPVDGPTHFDVIVTEATFMRNNSRIVANARGHSLASQAVAALGQRCDQLILTHFGQEFPPEHESVVDFQIAFPDIVLATDLLKITIN